MEVIQQLAVGLGRTKRSIATVDEVETLVMGASLPTEGGEAFADEVEFRLHLLNDLGIHAQFV